jgi:hypothetical protein
MTKLATFLCAAKKSFFFLSQVSVLRSIFLHPENAIRFPSLAFNMREHIISSKLFALQNKESEFCPS